MKLWVQEFPKPVTACTIKVSVVFDQEDSPALNPEMTIAPVYLKATEHLTISLTRIGTIRFEVEARNEVLRD